MLILMAVGFPLLVVFSAGASWLLVRNHMGNRYARVATTILVGFAILVTSATAGLFMVWPPLK
ncbi:MAG: hypothetical protein ACYC2T_06850 [Bacillota bacterium]